jgi:murein DD-endopeptidase MepM/ murein hydrolase activator NlpD
VVRTFPSSTSARAAAALLAASGLLAGALSPLAHADDLKGKRHTVERRIAGANDDLDESSAQVRHAAASLTAARTRLAGAQTHLADTRGKLAAAQALDKEMAARLAAAQERLAQSRADLAAGRRKIAGQQTVLRRIVVANYQSGDPSLMGLSLVLTTQDPEQLSGQLGAVQDVMDKQAVVLDRLEATRALLTVQEQGVEAAERQVAQRREDAARDLARTRSLEAQAVSAEASVRHLVDVRSAAQRRARAARSADLAALRGLQREQDRIAALLRERAQRARARWAGTGTGTGAGTGTGTGGAVHSGGVLDYPVSGPVTSPFGWRIHPIFGYRSLHNGVDFGVGCGTPIRAAASGRVVARYFQTAWGNRVIIDHGIHQGVDVATITNHMNTPAIVAPGQHVSRGQVVGYVGTTGWSTGCHLHFTVLRNGAPVNPMSWF